MLLKKYKLKPYIRTEALRVRYMIKREDEERSDCQYIKQLVSQLHSAMKQN